jgi:hypothetical protein
MRSALQNGHCHIVTPSYATTVIHSTVLSIAEHVSGAETCGWWGSDWVLPWWPEHFQIIIITPLVSINIMVKNDKMISLGSGNIWYTINFPSVTGCFRGVYKHACSCSLKPKLPRNQAHIHTHCLLLCWALNRIIVCVCVCVCAIMLNTSKRWTIGTQCSNYLTRWYIFLNNNGGVGFLHTCMIAPAHSCTHNAVKQKLRLYAMIMLEHITLCI